MIQAMNLLLNILMILLLCFPSLSAAAASPPSSPPSCPMDMNYVVQIAWNKTYCIGYEPPQATEMNDTTKIPCCQTLISLFGAGLAKRLKDTSNFLLPSAATARSCLIDFQANLSSLGLSNDVVSFCLAPDQFVIRPNLCANIQTIEDWVALVGTTTELDSACRAGLVDLVICDGCVNAGTKVLARLVSADGNASHSRDCFYFTVLYAAGIVNGFWPESYGAMNCILGMSMDSQPGVSNSTPAPAPASNMSMVFGFTGAAVAVFVILSLLGLYFFYDRKWRKNDGGFDVEAFLRNYGCFVPKRYSYAQVKRMTNSFAKKIGNGGYGAVYKGKLPDGCSVAVKMLKECKGNGEEFMNEVASIGRTSHVNVVTLVGFCYERKKRALVYEYMPNGSLDKFIFNQESSNIDSHLERKTLYDIAVGVARGLEYLHRGCNTTILHFDIKPQNILLDKDLSPKISDFGLAKLWLKKENTVSMVGARGTFGYMAPEVFSRTYGRVSNKSDVYSYGMLVLEMVGGRKNFDSGVSHTSEIYYPNWVYKDLEIMENKLSILRHTTEEEKELSMKMILVSFWCIQTNPSDRPSMSEVVDMLQGNLQSMKVPPKPFLFSPTRSRKQSPTASL